MTAAAVGFIRRISGLILSLDPGSQIIGNICFMPCFFVPESKHTSIRGAPKIRRAPTTPNALC